MKKLCTRALLVLAVLMMLNLGAFATDVPPNLIVNFGGLEWAWADPCAGIEPSCNASGQDLTLHDGWAYATPAQWALWGGDINLIYNLFENDPSEKCASSYFDSGYSHCDAGDLQAGAIWHAYGLCDPQYCDNPAADTILVRGGQGGVPEPGTMLLLGTGALGIVGRIRRKLTL